MSGPEQLARSGSGKGLPRDGYAPALGRAKGASEQQHDVQGTQSASSNDDIASSIAHRGDWFDRQFYKTQLCTYWQEGRCTRRVCRFAHGETELQGLPDLTRTAMCRILLQTGMCQDPDCSYAHHLGEVRATGSYFKTAMCRFLRRGTCKLGRQCRYAHSPAELRLPAELIGLEGLQHRSGTSSFEGPGNRDEHRSSSHFAAEASAPPEYFSAHMDAGTMTQNVQAWTQLQNYRTEPFMQGEGHQALEAAVQPHRLEGPWPSNHQIAEVAEQYRPSEWTGGYSSCSPAPAWNARQHEARIGTAWAQQQLPHGSQQASGRHLPAYGQRAYGSTALTTDAWSSASISPALSLAQTGACPSAGAGEAHRAASFGVAPLVRGEQALPRMAASPEQPPSWEPTIPLAALAASASEHTQGPWNLEAAGRARRAETQTLLREMQASILKASQPECYND